MYNTPRPTMITFPVFYILEFSVQLQLLFLFYFIIFNIIFHNNDSRYKVINLESTFWTGAKTGFYILC